MTTYCMKNGNIGYIQLFDNMAAFIGDAPIDVDEFCEHVIENVNRKLPDYITWYPHISEVCYDLDDDDYDIELDIASFWDGIHEAADEVEAEFYSEVE